jgi:hypothetical protein
MIVICDGQGKKIPLTKEEYDGAVRKIAGGGGWIIFKNRIGGVNLNFCKYFEDVEPYAVVDCVEFVDKPSFELAVKKGIIVMGVENNKNTFHFKKNAITINKNGAS